MLEHVADDRAALGELHRVAASDGRLLVTVPAYGWLWSQHDDDYHHFRRYTMRGIRGPLQANGWEPLAWSYFNTTLLAPIALVRLRARRQRSQNGRPDLRLTPPAVNRLLEQPLRVEAAMIARGVRLPAGVSIGLVCAARDPARH